MTVLAAGASVTITLRDDGLCKVATNGGAASVTITPASGASSVIGIGPLPVRQTFGPYAEGATLTISNQTAWLDYESPSVDLSNVAITGGTIAESASVAAVQKRLDENNARKNADIFTFDKYMVGASLPPSAGVQLYGAATAQITSVGVLSYVSDYAVASNGVILNRIFGEGKITFTVARGTFMFGVHTGADSNGFKVWSGGGTTVEVGYTLPGAVNIVPAIAMPGVAGDYLNVEVELGATAQGFTVNLRVWPENTARPAAPGSQGTFAADGAASVFHKNEGFIKLETFGTTPVLLKRIRVEDGNNGQSLAESFAHFSGRWFTRYEGSTVCMSTIRQGSSFRFTVFGTNKVTGAFVRPAGVTQSSILAVYVNDVFNQYVTITATAYFDLVTGLDVTKTYRVEVKLAGVHESDPVWIQGAGLLVKRLFAYNGTIKPWADVRPKMLFIGDSITAGIAAKNTPGVSLPPQPMSPHHSCHG
jgi:hypothetical protein